MAVGIYLSFASGEWRSRNTQSCARRVAEELDKCIATIHGPKPVFGWKPSGGGASESMITITENDTMRNVVMPFFKQRDWVALPAHVTSGICGEFITNNGDVRITAGHRLDFVGAADLGQDIAIGHAGCCCSCAIEPRTEIVLCRT